MGWGNAVGFSLAKGGEAPHNGIHRDSQVELLSPGRWGGVYVSRSPVTASAKRKHRRNSRSPVMAKAQCPKCGKVSMVADQFAGRKMVCKICETAFVVPASVP